MLTSPSHSEKRNAEISAYEIATESVVTRPQLFQIRNFGGSVLQLYCT